ncbi:hypothetical protein Tco_1388653 [Tanacetum coccineum]
MFQVVIDIIKNSTCFNAFTISADVPKIFMQQFWYTIKKAPDTDSYEFLLANKKCTVNAEVFRTILDICPRIEGVDFADVPDDDTALTFLIDLGYNGPLNRHTNVFVDHMHQPWRTLAAIINKENVDYHELIWEDLAYQIDHRKETRSRHDGIVSRLKFVRIDKDYYEYGLPIPDVMLTDAIKCSESYQMFIKYSTNQIPPKNSRGKDKKKTASRRVVKKKVTLSADDNIITDGPDVPNESIVISATSSEGIGAKPGVPDEDKDITKEKDDKDGDADEEGDDHVSDTKDADNEDVETKSDKDDIYKYKIRVRKDEDVEMKDAEVEGSDKDDEEITDAAKEEAEKTSKAKDDTKKTELPPSSASLSVSLSFGDQFLKLSSDSSLFSTVKDSAYVDVSSLLDIPIQHKTPQIKSPSVPKIPVSVIPKTTNLPPIPEIVTETPVTTSDPTPHVTPIILTVKQTTTLILTPTITIDAPTITTAIPKSNALSAV